jgi:SagB-type dehydrogenase family enzyme
MAQFSVKIMLLTGSVLGENQQVDVPKVFLDYLFMGQSSLTAAPVLIVLSAVWHRNMTKYGERGYRYMLLEAGHLMQNIILCAMQHGLASCNMGGFFDIELGDLLQLRSDEETAVYACALGTPVSLPKMGLRDLG